MIPDKAKPHEVAILLLWVKGKDTKQIAYELHYVWAQPVRRVIKRWEGDEHLLAERKKSLDLIRKLNNSRGLELVGSSL